MPTNNATKFFDDHYSVEDREWYCTSEGYTRLKAYLGKVKSGQPKVYTAPFAEGEDIHQVIDEWDRTLVSISDRWPSLYEFEVDLANKVGPLSVQLPLSERIGDIEHYYEDILLPQEPVDARAIKAVQTEFSSLRGLHLRNPYDTYDNMKKSSSAGTPTMGKRRDNLKGQIRSTICTNLGQQPDVMELLKHPLDGKTEYSLAAVVGWRGQEGGPEPKDTKQRVIWMFPSSLNLHELQLYQPLIEGAQKHDIVPAWVSMARVDYHITKLFDTKNPHDLVVCTDFSKFDQHFNRSMREASKSILSYIMYGDSATAQWLDQVFPAKYYIPLIIDAGKLEGYPVKEQVAMFYGEHGMASGSGGTNADETLAHRALQYEAAIRNNSRLNPHSMCLGDDGILTYPGITVEDVVKAYQSHGQVCNIDKQYASTQECVFLRRWHHANYRINGICAGVYSTNRALGKFRYLERFMDPEFWTKEMVVLRMLSIIENCNNHPLFEEFVDFCMKRDKYRLGKDIPGFFDNIVQIAQEATDNMQDFLGYTKTLQGEKPEGIAEWRVVKYLKSVA
nr:MAG: putative RNA-dependent RNA polymerase [Picobirnavirus sp.]